MIDESIYTLRTGSVPMLVSMPHSGVHIPVALRDRYLPQALLVEDTDWHLSRLYDFLDALGVSVLTPHTSRYVIDLNRPPDDTPMYPGAANTELCPTRFFNGTPLYQVGDEPTAEERAERRDIYWQPYHRALADELARLKATHGYALLWDAHSIRSEIPWLFEGRLPDLCIGTAGGASADASITRAVSEACIASPEFTSVVNGRFKGGYITRTYGSPQHHVHAIQLEMCQRTYMQESPPYAYYEPLAARLQPVLQHMIESALEASEDLYGK